MTGSQSLRGRGVTWGITWAKFLGICLLGSGVGLWVSLIANSLPADAFAIVFGACLISLSILERAGK